MRRGAPNEISHNAQPAQRGLFYARTFHVGAFASLILTIVRLRAHVIVPPDLLRWGLNPAFVDPSQQSIGVRLVLAEDLLRPNLKW